MQTKMTMRLVFDFRGDTFRLDTEITLPLYIDDLEEFIYTLARHIAQQHQIPIHSYEFEILETRPIEVIAFESRIQSALPPCPMPVEAFLRAYQSVAPEAYLQQIAQAYQLDLLAHPRIAKALKAAYTLGKEHRLPDNPSPIKTWLSRGFT